MELTTIVGMAFGFGCIVISIYLGGSIGSFIDMASVFITLGGTIAATVISYPSKILKSLGAVYNCAFKKNKINLRKDINLILDMANIARREGLLALENFDGMNDPFLKKGLMLVVDGTDPELIQDILEAEISFIQERHGQGQEVIDSMAGYAPAFGMVGTLIGLINMLQNLTDTDSLGPAMAVALITTFYGVILANLVFTPISKKLKIRTAAEVQEKELFLEGLLAIQNGENPRTIKDKLDSFLSKREIRKLESRQPGLKPEMEELNNAKEEKNVRAS